MIKGALWIVLTEESKNRIRQICPPIFSKVYIDHVTLQYNIELPEEYKPYVDSTQKILLKEICHNDKIQAIYVGIKLPSKNKFPHITISAKEGVHSVESNQMLESEHESTSIPGEIRVEGIVKFLPI